MEEKLETTKELFVILTRDPLVDQKFGHHKLLQHKNAECKLKNISTLGNIQLKELHTNEGTLTENHCTESIKAYNTYKKCIVVIKRLGINALKSQVQINPMKHLTAEKLPVYKQVTEDKSKGNNDQYEFDEPDFDSDNGARKVKQNLNRKKKVKISKVNKKKYKRRPKVYNTYNAAVQEILQKIMNKVNSGKSENKNCALIQKEIPLQQNISHKVQMRDDLSNIDDVHEYDDDIEINENDKENDIFCEHDTENNNSKNVCFCNPIKTNKRIHVISDITLNESDTFFNNLQPNANSTVLINEKCTPWRFNECLKRNPHYLNIKKTALPSLQQDMIIDYTQLKKIEEHFAKIPKKNENRANKPIPIRKSKLFYDVADKENVPHLSLFDSDNFIVDQPKVLRDNLSVNKPKRNILGPRLLNADNIMKPINISQNNVVETPAPVNEEFSKPDENLDMVPQDSLKESQSNNFVLKLFEDEEPVTNFNENSKIYIPKTRKKKKLHDNILESNEDKYKKHMTRKEEAELEQWAAKFNSLCEDIENYKLEIE